MSIRRICRLKCASLLAVVGILAIAAGVSLHHSSAFQQPTALVTIPVQTGSISAFQGASSGAHVSGNGAAGVFDVNPTNLRARSVVTGDFNVDGIVDVATGAPDATFTVTPSGGSPQTRTAAGTVHIVFGTPVLPATVDLGGALGTSRVLGAQSGDNLGFSLAVGDVNADSMPDLIIGAPGADFPGTTTPAAAARPDTGAVFIILAKPALQNTPTFDLGAANTADSAIFGVRTDDRFGTAVAVGNAGGVPADSLPQQGAADILIGAPANVGPDIASPRAGGGAAFLVFGGSGLNRSGANTTIRDLGTTAANVIIYGKTGDAVGASVAVGDINGGGLADLIMGAPLSDRTVSDPITAAVDTGAVFAVFGGDNLNPSSGTSKTFDINTTQQNLSVYGAGNVINPGTNDADHLGVSVATGDVTGDGIRDLLMGAPDADGPIENRSSAGEAYLILGGTGLNPSTGTHTRLDLGLGSSTALRVHGAAAGDRYGMTVHAGSLNVASQTDIVPEFIVGAPGAQNRAGIVSVIFGGPNLLVLPIRDLLLSQDDVRVVGAGSGELGGQSLRLRERLTTSDTTVSPSLQDVTATVNATGGTTVITETSDATAAGGFNITGSTFTGATVSGTGTAANVVLTNNPALTFNPGDATNDFVQVANSAALRPGTRNWTVEFWITRNGAGAGDPVPIVSSRSFASPTAAGFTVALDAATNKVVAIMGDGTTGFSLQSTSSVGTTPEHWSVVFDRSGNQVIFYKNGSVDALVTIPGGSNPGSISQTDPLFFGGDSAGGTRFLNATLDDVRIWGLTRSAQQIADNDTAELGGSEAGLIGYWKFNEASGATVNDSTSNGNNGTITNATRSLFVNRFVVSGERVSPLYSLSGSPGSLITSSLVFNATTPTSTGVVVETSLDGGTTWQQATSGGVIPSLGFGDELGWAIATGDVNNNLGSDLIVGAPFATANVLGNARPAAGIVYVVASTEIAVPPNVAPTVTVTAPNGGENLSVGSVFTITWTASDPNGDETISRFRVELSTSGGGTFPLVISEVVAGNQRTFLWTVPPGFDTTQGRIRVTAFDDNNAEASDVSDANFTIADVGVSVTVATPNGGETLNFGQQIPITWTVPAAAAGQVKGFDVLLSTDGGATFPISITTPTVPSEPALGPTSRIFLWTVPTICTSSARITVVATSFTNRRSSDSSNANFTLQEAPPTVDTTRMRLLTDTSKLEFQTTTPAGGTEVLFEEGVQIEVSADAAGTSFLTFSKPAKIKKNGRKLLSKGQINGESIQRFFPNGATRVIRITNPVCGRILLRVTRDGGDLVFAPVAQSEQVWQ